MALLDLTQPFTDGMFRMSTLPPIEVGQACTIEEHGVNITTLACSVHSGTHIDAPCHFIAGGRDIEALALTDVSGAGVCVSIPCEELQEIGAEDLERAGAGVREGDIVMIHTGWSRFFTTDPTTYARHPFLGADAAQWLVDRGIKMVAIDVATPDAPEPMRADGFAFPAHKILLGSDVLIAEHLAGLGQIAGRRVRAYAFPIPISHSDGSMVRFVAEL